MSPQNTGVENTPETFGVRKGYTFSEQQFEDSHTKTLPQRGPVADQQSYRQKPDAALQSVRVQFECLLFVYRIYVYITKLTYKLVSEEEDKWP